ncbi:MAG: hypothetical protein AAGD04_07310 [Pseudomonadota bacterium]
MTMRLEPAKEDAAWEDKWSLPTTLARARALAENPGQEFSKFSAVLQNLLGRSTTVIEPLAPEDIAEAFCIPVLTDTPEHQAHDTLVSRVTDLTRAGSWSVLAEDITGWDQNRRAFASGKRYTATASVAAMTAMMHESSNLDEDETGPISETVLHSLVKAQEADPQNYVLAGLLARAHIHNGWVSHGSIPTEAIKRRDASSMEERFREAAGLLDHFNPIERNSPFLAETRYKLLPAFVDADRFLIDWFEDWRDLDPFALAPHALQGYYLLPRWYGTYERIEAEAVRSTNPMHDGLEAGAYAAFYLQALDADPKLASHVDAPLFLTGLDEIATHYKSDPILVNMLLAWFCLDFKPKRSAAGKFENSTVSKMVKGRKFFATRHLSAIVPGLWRGGEEVAFRELGKIFANEIAAGEVAQVSGPGLRFGNPVRA